MTWTERTGCEMGVHRMVVAALTLACSSAEPMAPATTADTPSPAGTPAPSRAEVFADITGWAGLDFDVPGFGAAFLDFDGDGDDDLVLPGVRAAHVLRNRGDGSFEALSEIDHEGEQGAFAYAIDLTGDGVEEVLYLLGRGISTPGIGPRPNPEMVLERDPVTGLRKSAVPFPFSGSPRYRLI